MKTNRIVTRCSALALSAMVCTMVGCSSAADSRHAGDINMLRADPTPAMHTLARRETDRVNNITVSNETNLRMIYNDIDRMLLFIDRPSHLTPFPSKH